MYDMQQRGLVRFVTAPLLRQMGEYVRQMDEYVLVAYDRQTILLPAGPDGPDGTPSADPPILSIVLTDYGKEIVEHTDM